MPFYPNERISDPLLNTDFGDKVAKAAKQITCKLWSEYPSFLVAKELRPIKRLIYDNLCRDAADPLPPGTGVQFTGGQCVCALYNISYQTTIISTGVTTVAGSQKRGPVGNITSVDASTPASPNRERVFIPVGAPACIQQLTLFEGERGLRKFKILSITPTAQQPNNCGNPPPAYPDGDRQPPSSLTEGDVTIINEDGLDLTVPYVFVDADLNVNANLRVGPFDIRFDLGGIDINIGADEDAGVNPPLPPPGTGDSITNIENDITNLDNRVSTVIDIVNNISDTVDEVKDTVDEFENCCPPEVVDPEDPAFPPEYAVQTFPPAKSRTALVSGEIVSVRLDITSIPPLSKRQDGGDAPDVAHVGWFEWLIGGIPYAPRIPINFLSQTYIAPRGVNGFAYTCTQAQSGSVILVKKVPV